jgi:hypothetical protein
LGWVLPGQVFTLQGSVGWGVWSLLYAVAGVIVTGVIFILRRRVLGGTELALYWFALVSFLACAGVSMGTWLGSAGTINADLLMSGIAIVTAAALIFLRRAKIGGLEFAVYWFGLALVLFWGTISFLAEPVASSAIGTYFNDIYGYRSAGIVLSGVVVLSALAILLLRRSKLNGPELAVYLIGVANMLYRVAARLS